MCAGPVSFEIINLAELIKDTKKFNLIGFYYLKQFLHLIFCASFISSGPGATNTGYLFL